MFRLPDSVYNGHEPAFWIVATCAVVLNLAFFASLAMFTRRTRGPLRNAGVFFCVHAVVGAVALPFILAAQNEERVYLSIALWLIDAPLVVLVDSSAFSALESTFNLRSDATVAALYVALGGAVYAILGFVLGLLASMVRRAAA